MSLKDLQALGAFVPTKPFKRSVECDKPVLAPEGEWESPDVPEFTGETERVSIDVYFKRMSSADEVAIAQAPADLQPFVMVFRLVRNEDGSPLFESVGQAASMASWVLAPIISEIETITGSRPKKPLTRPTHSGSKSRSGSAAEARKSGRK